MKTTLKTVLALTALAAAAQAGAQVTLYENDDYGGQQISVQRRMPSLRDYGFNDRASSLIIQRDRWEVCEDNGFAGRCVVLGPGRYPSLRSIGFNDRISSVRAVNVAVRDDRDDDRPGQRGDYRRRNGERLYTANVTSVRAVVGTPEQRCWVERQPAERRANVGGAVVGGLIGGILGHQIGGGSGRALATAGGAVAGAAVGANVNRDEVGGRDVQRCANVQGSGQQRPEYWDVTYTFRGQEHHVQTTEPPGATITVNDRGEPRTS